MVGAVVVCCSLLQDGGAFAQAAVNHHARAPQR